METNFLGLRPRAPYKLQTWDLGFRWFHRFTCPPSRKTVDDDTASLCRLSAPPGTTRRVAYHAGVVLASASATGRRLGQPLPAVPILSIGRRCGREYRSSRRSGDGGFRRVSGGDSRKPTDIVSVTQSPKVAFGRCKRLFVRVRAGRSYAGATPEAIWSRVRWAEVSACPKVAGCENALTLA